MKNNFEQSIKDSLEGFELPYDPQAWTAMSKRLDAIQPVAPPKGGAGKWIAAAGIVVATTVGVLYLTQKETPATTTTAQNSETVSDTKSTSNSRTGSQGTVEQTATQGDHDNSPAVAVQSHDQGATPAGENPFGPGNSGNGGNSSGGSKGSTFVKSGGTSSGNTGTKPLDGIQTPDPFLNVPTPSTQVIIPQVKNMCQGNQVTLTNENAFDLLIITPNRDEIRMRPGVKTTFTLNQSGKYTIVRQISKSDELGAFQANASPRPDFTIDEQTQFENGIPAIPLETYSEGSDFTWSFEGSKVVKRGTTSEATFFKKGTHTITLTSQNELGCKGSVSKTVTIDEDYNLLAPNAFMPDHSDNRKNRFIPYALSVRNVEFNMIIIDPRTGATIYQSSDVQGWDGVDRTTGRMVDQNTTYIWKVSLKNPLPGERSEYSGTVAVVRM